MQRPHVTRSQSVAQLPVSPPARLFFFTTKLSWLWLLVRLYVGYQWLSAGAAKLTGYACSFGSLGQPSKGGSWLVDGHGAMMLTDFFQHSLSLAHGASPAVQDWYAALLQHVALPGVGVLAYLIPLGETLVGLGLIFGACTGITATFGALLSINYLLAGAVALNPILLVLEILLLLAWRVAGFYGLDYYLLPRLIVRC